MALIINPKDPQNIFYKADKITSEIYLIFVHNEEILNCKMGKQVKSQLQVIPIPEGLDKQLRTCGNYNKFRQELLILKIKNLYLQSKYGIEIVLLIFEDEMEGQKINRFKNEVFFNQPISNEVIFNFFHLTKRFQQSSMNSLIFNEYIIVERINGSLQKNSIMLLIMKIIQKQAPNLQEFNLQLEQDRQKLLFKISKNYDFEEYYELNIYSRYQESQILKYNSLFLNLEKQLIGSKHDQRSILLSYLQIDRLNIQILVIRKCWKQIIQVMENQRQSHLILFLLLNKLLKKEEDNK
ncbi:unnamed protein product [Paramecium pentaurelia]|uniref:Uncharacterized protein n=1 Tax=Paramecium pentaurelia TaxID=43138 RepID=A0A8S1XSL7_9CILI|nr:unnamed protein product [Paramecium pentaurelia]